MADVDSPEPTKRTPVSHSTGRRIATATGYLAAAAAVVVLLGGQASVPGVDVLGLELAGTADRARSVQGSVADGPIAAAIWWDCGFVVGYVALLIIGLRIFPQRAYRVKSFRAFAGSGQLMTGVVGLLDLVENGAMLIGLSRSGDGWWQVAATASWAKWLIVLVIVAYVLVALFTYLITPEWVQKLFFEPPAPNVRQNSQEAAHPGHGQLTGGTPLVEPGHTITPARFGIAASGGGIRSASLVLGSLQALDRAYPDRTSPGPSWSTADKIASVSGGSYISGGYSVARSSRTHPEPGQPRPSSQAWRIGSGEEKRLLNWLGYLLAANPSGQVQSEDDRARSGSDLLGVVTLVVAGLALNAGVLFSLLWLLVRPYGWLLKSSIMECRSPDTCRVEPFLVQPVLAWAVITVLILIIWVGTGWIRPALEPNPGLQKFVVIINRGARPIAIGLIALTAVLAVVLIGVPALITVVPDWLQEAKKLITPAWVIAAIGSLGALARSLSKQSARFAPYVAGGLFLALVVLIVIQWLINADPSPAAQLRYLIMAGGWLVLYLLVSAEWWSIAGFYRARLRLAFATFRTARGSVRAFGNGNAPRASVEPSIYEFHERQPGRPTGSPLQICATAHASTREVRTHYGIPAMSVTFSPETMRVHRPIDDEGGWTAYQVSTERLESLMFRRNGARLTSFLAVGVSGAAVAPAMGQYRIGPLRALLAVANIRLGVWLPNPMYAAAAPTTLTGRRPDHYRSVPYPRPRLGYLLKELFGLHDPDDLYIYVTDGGHWENTGLVELIRDRTIDEVVCLDADERPRETATEIALAIGLAKLECNADVLLDLDVLRGPHDGLRGTDYSPQSVALGVIRRGDHLGLLWYAKPVLTKDTPLDLLSYAEVDDSYPTTSTVDQFFHTAQFKAYRDLGRYNGEEIVRARAALLAATAQAATLADFLTLAQAPDAHWALRSLVGLRLTEADYRQLRQRLASPSTFALLTPPPPAP